MRLVMAAIGRVLRFGCSCDCMSCVHGQHCGACMAADQAV